MKIIPSLIFLYSILSFFSCKKVDPNYQCSSYNQSKFSNQTSILEAYPSDVFELLYNSKKPLADGSLGRNKDGYFHVRFQMDMYFVAAYAVTSQNESVLNEFINSLEYSFDHQLNDGNFEFIIPDEISDSKTATEGDTASAVAFFLSAVANSMLTIENSSWYSNLSDTSFSYRIGQLKPKMELSLNWLTSKKSILETVDAEAPNRLFFNAIAFYGLGKLLDIQAAKNIGIGFINKGLLLRDPNGYFLEKGGWDSSYQGVALMNGFQLILMLDQNESIYNNLWSSITCGCDWQKSRVLKNGEISLKDNTRVYKGGEEFLGNEKGVAWLDTYMSFLIMTHLSGGTEFSNNAADVRDYYE